MTQKIAIAVIHGIGKTNPDFADKNNPDKFVSGIAQELKKQLAKILPPETDIDSVVAIEAIYWAPVLQRLQDELFDRLKINELSDPFGLRDFIFHSLADSVGYQITPSNQDIYDQVHKCISQTLNKLSLQAGALAPLCIIAHSLGAVIASNYIWDQQNNLMPGKVIIGDSELEKGNTLTLFYTLGSQLPFWRLRYKDFGTPITIPSPKLSQHYPNLQGEWLNFYDRDDLLGYPIKSINEKYKQAVTADIEVNAGNMLTSWNPLSHNAYWTDEKVTKMIAEKIAQVWQQVNAI